MQTQRRKTDKLGHKQYSKSERRELIQKYQVSGMSQSAFCKAYGLIGTTLSGWLHLMRKKKKEEFPVAFAEVELQTPEVSLLEVEVICPDGNGLWISIKKLQKGTFSWPSGVEVENSKLKLSNEALILLLNGVDLKGSKLRPWYQRE